MSPRSGPINSRGASTIRAWCIAFALVWVALAIGMYAMGTPGRMVLLFLCATEALTVLGIVFPRQTEQFVREVNQLIGLFGW